MANPKEKQFEYYENVKKNAFMFFTAVDRSRSECNKRFSLDSSSLLNKRRASLPRLMKNDSSNNSENENESSPATGTMSSQKKTDNPLKLEFGFVSVQKKSKFNKEKPQLHYKSIEEKGDFKDNFKDRSENYEDINEKNGNFKEIKKKKKRSGGSSMKSSVKSSDSGSNISSEEKSQN